MRLCFNYHFIAVKKGVKQTAYITRKILSRFICNLNFFCSHADYKIAPMIEVVKMRQETGNILELKWIKCEAK